MLYYIIHPFIESLSGLRLFEYISFRAAGAALTALLISFIVGPIIINLLIKLQIGETIKEAGPSSHKKKSGTPTMGGLIILASVIIPSLLWCRLDHANIKLILIATIWMGCVGFLDDYLKIIKKLPLGLIARYKIIGQISLGLFIGTILTTIEYSFPIGSSLQTVISIPFIANGFLDIGWFYIPLVIIVITGTSNAVNLTDGLDGLATGLVAISTLTFAGIAYITGRVDFSNYLNILYIPNSGELFIYCSALTGACIGFLWYNAYPAKIFMGDTGSLAIGAALGTLAVLLKKEILLIIIGGVFVAESISVIMQISYYKYNKKKYGTGKRLFKMAPLHHHFELLGWNENHVVVRFWIIGVLLALLSLTTFKIQ